MHALLQLAIGQTRGVAPTLQISFRPSAEIRYSLRGRRIRTLGEALKAFRAQLHQSVSSRVCAFHHF